MLRLKYLALLSVTVMLSLGISISQSFGIEKPESTEKLLASGKRVYQEKCAICHGKKGDGAGEVAHLLYPRPMDFTLAVFKIRSTPTGSLPTDEDVFRSISEGMTGTAMLPFKDALSEKERWAVVYFVKTFSERWEEEEIDKPISIGVPLPKTEELLTLGKKVYKEMKCWECHGYEGKGDGSKSDSLKDNAEIPIFPYDFTLPGRMKGGNSVSQVVRTYMAGMDGTPMPAYEVNLSEKEQWALAYYTLSLGAGKPAPKIIGHRIAAQRHKGRLPLDPVDSTWRRVKGVEMPVQPLWTWTKKKTIEAIRVRALYNEHEIAIMVEWDDPIVNSRLTIQEFSDAVAVQFPLLGRTGKNDRAFFGMGDHKQAVNIWYWKAASQVEAARRRQDVKTASDPFAHPLSVASAKRVSLIEDLNAAKPGTLTSQLIDSQQVDGKGVWTDGKWRVVFRRELKTGDPNDVRFRVGGSYPISFAVWDGDTEDRDGKKAVTPWQVIEIKTTR